MVLDLYFYFHSIFIWHDSKDFIYIQPANPAYVLYLVWSDKEEGDQRMDQLEKGIGEKIRKLSKMFIRQPSI